MRILIVKMSALGDVIQSLCVVDSILEAFPDAIVDFVVDESFASIVRSHSKIHKTIAIPWQSCKKNRSFKTLQSFVSSIKNLRSSFYDVVFDLQGNCKSGVVNLLTKAQKKVGFSYPFVREFPNVFSTNIRFPIHLNQNISLQYISLVSQFFQRNLLLNKHLNLSISKQERSEVDSIVSLKRAMYWIMVAPGSKWQNKQLDFFTWKKFLQKIRENFSVEFLFIWGSEEELQFCSKLQSDMMNSHVLSKKLDFPVLQNLMKEMDFFLGVDSSALHLCATTNTATFGFFGPTNALVYNPFGDQHVGFQGQCPYGERFVKVCPKLRSCLSGACLKRASDEALFNSFSNVFQKVKDLRIQKK